MMLKSFMKGFNISLKMQKRLVKQIGTEERKK